jgi:hypothetical protein
MSMLSLLEIAGVIALCAVLILAGMRWANSRRIRMHGAREAAQRRLRKEEMSRETAKQIGTMPVAAGSPPEPIADPRVLAKIRVGREGNRPSEDDIVQRHFGPRGVPGEPVTPKDLDEAVTQIPKPLDPGHTA